MAKGLRKKQRLEAEARDVQALGSRNLLQDDSQKDNEERRLESILFGTAFNSRSITSGENVIVLNDEGGATENGGNELEHLEDKDLFFVDDAQPDAHSDSNEALLDDDLAENIEVHSESDGQNVMGGEDDVSQEEGASNGPTTALSSSMPQSNPPKQRKKAAWIDPDDAALQVSLSEDKRLRKLRDGPDDDVVGGTQYEARLRREFERINPAPEWASAARKQARAKKRRRSSTGMDIDDEGEDAGALLRATDGILSTGRDDKLVKGVLAIERLRDANQSAKAEGPIRTIEFHPSPRIPVLLTASSDRRMRLFNIDGHTNPHIQTVHIPSLPLSNAMFHPNGTSILMTGPRPFYYTMDLQTGTTARSPRGLWGTTFTSSDPSKQGDGGMETCAFSPTGDILAVAGRRGYVHLVDWRTGGAQVIGSVKMNATVKALWWSPSGGELMSLGDDTEVYVWDLKERRCVKRWRDDGGYGSVVMSGDRTGNYLGIGSKTGLVNVYGSDAIGGYSESSPKVLKTLSNLTTSISTLRFNHDNQLLAMASNYKKDQMRLVHLPSLTTYSNWPTSSTPLGHVTAIDFSKGSEYIAVGNNRGRVLLYQLSHFISGV